MPDGLFAFSAKKGKINTLSAFQEVAHTQVTDGIHSAWNIGYWPFWAKAAMVLSFLLPLSAYLTLNMLSMVGLGFSQQSPVRTSQESQTSVFNQTSTSSWKTYTNYDANFSIQYPSHWILFVEPKKPGDTSQKASIKGLEGTIDLLWGSGFGGVCPDAYIDVSVQNGVLKACHTIEDGLETWGGLSNQNNGMSFTANAVAKSPIEKNRETILKILSSLEFH